MKKFNDVLMTIVHILERIIAIVLMVVVVLAGAYMIKELFGGFKEGFDIEFLKKILAHAFTIVIIIEFIRVLIKHTMGTVVETLIFALARGLIVESERVWEMAVTIVAIVLLLAARKYLFINNDLKKIKNED